MMNHQPTALVRRIGASARAHRCALLFLTALVLPACDDSDSLGGGAGGNGGGSAANAGQSGSSTQPRPSLISTNHYQVTAPSSVTSASAGQGGTSSGAQPSGGASGNGGSASALLACVLDVPSGTSRGVCGDGFVTGNEQCDDGNTANGDACSSACAVTPLLVAPHPGSSSPLPFPGRELGNSNHSAAVGCNTVGLAYLDHAASPAALELALFSGVGHAQGVVDLGPATVDSPSPALAALPDDTFVAVWTALDSDELGIRLRKVAVGSPQSSTVTYANVEQAFTQRAPDIVFDGSQFVVAWVDDSEPANGPDLRFRTFAPDLSPTSDEQTLAATAAVEDHVTLAALDGHWAAAWRAGSAGMETIEVQSGSSHWSVGPFWPGASDDRPALTFVDATHLALAFTSGTDPWASGVANVPRLHAAVLDTAYPGHAESFAIEPTVAPYDTALDLAQTQPAVVSFADRLVVGWRSGSVIGEPAGDELWSREVKWALAPQNKLTFDTSAAEQRVLADGALRAGDQSHLALLTSSRWPGHRLLSVWQEDSHRVLQSSSGLPDVLLQFSESPGELPAPPAGPCLGMQMTASPAGPAVAFSSVTFTGTATCGAGAEAEYRYGYRAPGSADFVFIRDWGPATVNWSTAGLPSGLYSIYGYTRQKGSNVGFDSTTGLNYLVGRVCNTNPTFGLSPTGPQPLSTPISLSAAADCTLGGTPEYRFIYQRSGTSTWQDIGAWSKVPVTWDTIGLPDGRYDLIAYVRRIGNSSVLESQAYGSVLLGKVCYAVNSVTGSPVSPQAVGTPISLAAAATCISGATPEFRYYYYSPDGGPAVQVGNWSADPVHWDTTGLPPGNFALYAYPRAQGNLSVFESGAYGGFQLGALCPSVSMSASPTGVQPIGTSITVTANAGCSPAEYLFLYRLWGTTAWLKLRDWLTSPSATWDTTGLASGQYELMTQARFAGHTGPETSTQINSLIGNVCSATTIAASPPSPQPVGTTVTLTGSASCNGGASAEYQFSMEVPGSATVALLRDWGSASFDWPTAALAPGAYNVFAAARAAGNADGYESFGQQSFTLQP